MGVFWTDSVGAVQWVCSGQTQLVQSSGCVLMESEGAVQWVHSGGNQRVWSNGCVLEKIRGCSPVGVFWRE